MFEGIDLKLNSTTP